MSYIFLRNVEESLVTYFIGFWQQFVTMQVEDFLSHPLFLLLVGAILSGFLIPFFTRKWQDHQKELDLKINLLSDMTQSILDIINAVQIMELKPYKAEKQKFEDDCHEWEKSAASIETHLKTYFPSESIIKRWNTFSELVRKFYGLSMNESKRDKYIEDIKRILSNGYDCDLKRRPKSIVAGKIIVSRMLSSNRKNSHWPNHHYDLDIDALILAKKEKSYDEYEKNWLNLKNQILTLNADLINRIVKLRIDGFG